MNQTDKLPPRVNQMGRNALFIGVGALVISILGFFLDPNQFYKSYLLGFMYTLQFPLGCLGLLMVHQLAGGRWGFSIRRLLEAGAMTMPLLAVLAIPVVIGIPSLYLWADPAAVADSHLLQHKSLYLNVPFFIARMVAYFIIWISLAYLLNQWSAKQDQDTSLNPNSVNRFKALSAAGLILYMLTATFAAFDWMMSLMPYWFSSIYGVIYIVGGGIATVTLSIIVGRSLMDQEPLSGVLNIDAFNDLSNWMLAFVSFWAYVSFSQFLIYYQTNIPETITFYVVRMAGGWQVVGLALVFLGFGFPFVLLMSRTLKRMPRVMVPLAVLLLFMRWVGLFWQIMPAFYETFHLHWLDILLPIGMSGIWVSLFIRQLKRKPLVALHDPRFQEAPAHG